MGLTSRQALFGGVATVGIGGLAYRDLIRRKDAAKRAADEAAKRRAILEGPNPDLPIVTPKLFVSINRPTDLFLDSLRCGQAPRIMRGYNGQSKIWRQLGRRLVCDYLVEAGPGPLVVDTLDPNTLRVLGSATYTFAVFDPSRCGGAQRKVLAVGDSLMASGAITGRILERADDDKNAWQPVLIGTRGGNKNRHEAHPGKTVSFFYEGGPDNPFSMSGSRFNAPGYFAKNGLPRPDDVVWELGINDVFGLASDAEVHAKLDEMLFQLGAMMGLVTDDSVVPFARGTRHFICLPVAPSAEQAAFGQTDNYLRARYLRNIGICQWRLATHYWFAEGSNVFLVPTNAAIDPAHSFTRNSRPANAQIERTISTVSDCKSRRADLGARDGALFRCSDIDDYLVKVGPPGSGFYDRAGEADGIISSSDNALHPAHGYEQIGDMLYDHIGGLIRSGLAA